jgi:hypothetical protein
MQNDIGYISHEELVFSPEKNIQSGGFSVSSIMMKAGLSPIMTMNVNTDSIGQNGGSNKVSDLFQNLAVPNWATMYTMKGGEYKEQEKEQEKDKKKQEKEKRKGKGKDKKEGDSDSDSDIDDDLHDKLLDLVKEHENITKKKNNKSKRTDKKEKKNITKKNKKQKKEEK